MIDIYLNSADKALDFNSFEKEMINICKSHLDQNRAIAFAFILYDFENPQVWKVLNDREYWLALNQISGNYLTVFSLNYKEPEISNGLEKTASLSTISTNVNLTESTSSLVNQYFNNIRVRYPAILFFQVDGDKIIDSLIVELNAEKIEDSFIELKEYIKKTANTLKKITDENKKNYQEIFDCIEREIQSQKNSKKLKRITKVVGNVIDLISSVKGLF